MGRKIPKRRTTHSQIHATNLVQRTVIQQQLEQKTQSPGVHKTPVSPLSICPDFFCTKGAFVSVTPYQSAVTKRLLVLLALAPPAATEPREVQSAHDARLFSEFCRGMRVRSLSRSHPAEGNSYASLNGAARSSEGGAASSSMSEEHLPCAVVCCEVRALFPRVPPHVPLPVVSKTLEWVRKTVRAPLVALRENIFRPHLEQAQK